MKSVLLFLFMIIVPFFNAERTQAMDQTLDQTPVGIVLPRWAIYSFFSDKNIADCQLMQIYTSMDDENRKYCWEKTEARHEREETWPLLVCIDDGRVRMVLAFLDDGCPLVATNNENGITTENIAKVIIEYFRSERYLDEMGDYCERLLGKLSDFEQIKAKRIIKAILFPQKPVIEFLRLEQFGNPSAKWLLETIIDAE